MSEIKVLEIKFAHKLNEYSAKVSCPIRIKLIEIETENDIVHVTCNDDYLDNSFSFYLNIPILNKDNYNFYNSSNSIKSLGLSIDFKEREPPRDADYYRYLEKYFTMKNAVDSNILLYSFCLDNNRLQPNGNINLSSLNNLCLDLELKNPEKDTKGKETYKYNVSVFLKYYNIIDYVNGAGSLKYGN